MSEEDIVVEDAAPVEEAGNNAGLIYDADGVLLQSVVEATEQAIAEDDSDAVRAILRDLHQSEVGDILHAIDEESRDKLVALAGDAFDFAALTEVDEIGRASCRERV